MADHHIEKRKSVSFSDGAVVFDEHGEQSTQSHQEKATAESHSTKSGESDSAAPSADTVAPTKAATEEDVDADADADFADLKKKKKKSKSKTAENEDEGAAEVDDDDDFDASALKEMKKKKKKKSAAATEEAGPGEEDDLDAAMLKELKKKKKEKKEKKKDKKDRKGGEDGSADGAGPDGETDEAKAEREAQEGDMELGTGIWAHDAVTPIAYDLLLTRFFAHLHATNPGFAVGSEKNFKIPPPECRREGNKKTIFANINEISARVKRTMEHVMSFLFTELGTSGSVDGAQRLVIKGRYQQKQLENVLIRYINEYVLCKTCRSVSTELEKGENRLHFVRCNKCGSRRSVAAIKSGFSAQIGRRKRAA